MCRCIVSLLIVLKLCFFAIRCRPKSPFRENVFLSILDKGGLVPISPSLNSGSVCGEKTFCDVFICSLHASPSCPTGNICKTDFFEIQLFWRNVISSNVICLHSFHGVQGTYCKIVSRAWRKVWVAILHAFQSCTTKGSMEPLIQAARQMIIQLTVAIISANH